MPNLLGDIFLRSQNVTDKEFIGKLAQRGIEYTVKRIDTGTYITVGRFGYGINAAELEAGYGFPQLLGNWSCRDWYGGPVRPVGYAQANRRGYWGTIVSLALGEDAKD